MTKIAHAQITKFGMNDKIGPMCIPENEEDSMSSEKPYSRMLGNIIDVEVRNLVASAYKKTEEILTENRDKLTKVENPRKAFLRSDSSKIVF